MLIGIPTAKEGKHITQEIFGKYIPKLATYVNEHKETFELYENICRNQLNYTIWEDIWDYALSLATAHYICISDPQSLQSIDSSTAAGGVMSSRSIDKVSYQYETSKTMSEHDAYLFWNQTGYGRALYALSLTRGYIGMFIGT